MRYSRLEGLTTDLIRAPPSSNLGRGVAHGKLQYWWASCTSISEGVVLGFGGRRRVVGRLRVARRVTRLLNREQELPGPGHQRMAETNTDVQVVEKEAGVYLENGAGEGRRSDYLGT